MRKPTKNKGFTLIEILLVVVIIGIMLAVIVPRAWRANVDTKYNLIRQNCNELGSFALQWVEQQMEAQPENEVVGTTFKMYLDSLDNGWVARNNSNFIGYNAVNGRVLEASVQDTVPPDKHPRNPFNGASIFVDANDPITQNHVVAGALLCGGIGETSGYRYYAFLWQGTDSLSIAFNLDGSFHAAQKTTNLEGYRNGVFLARARN